MKFLCWENGVLQLTSIQNTHSFRISDHRASWNIRMHSLIEVCGVFHVILTISLHGRKTWASGDRRKGWYGKIYKFGSFMFDLGFIKLPLIRKRFTWFQLIGFTVSRLDLVLILEGWWDKWGVSCNLVFPTISKTIAMWLLGTLHMIRGQKLLDLITFV
jgi:hypothetical protein